MSYTASSALLPGSMSSDVGSKAGGLLVCRKWSQQAANISPPEINRRTLSLDIAENEGAPVIVSDIFHNLLGMSLSNRMLAFSSLTFTKIGWRVVGVVCTTYIGQRVDIWRRESERVMETIFSKVAGIWMQPSERIQSRVLSNSHEVLTMNEIEIILLNLVHHQALILADPILTILSCEIFSPMHVELYHEIFSCGNTLLNHICFSTTCNVWYNIRKTRIFVYFSEAFLINYS